MADKMDQAEVADRLWRAIEHGGRTGMLGVVGGEPQHFQPMTAFVERESGQIWFYTYRDTDLAEAAGTGASAMFVVQRDKLQACIGGRLSQQHDPARIERYWGPVVAAWYPEGKDDPRLTLLRLDCEDAQVWITEAGPVKFAWEIARANAAGRTPDLGERTGLDLQ